MRVLALDISSSTGYCLLDWAAPAKPVLVHIGCIANPKKIADYGAYPLSFVKAVEAHTVRLEALVSTLDPDVVVIEEINGGGRMSNRHTQKFLDALHHSFLFRMTIDSKFYVPIVYINTSDWRRACGIQMSAADKKSNTKLAAAKLAAARAGKTLDKKALGIRGKINKKHLAINWCNEHYDLELLAKDDDLADALCQAHAYTLGCPHTSLENKRSKRN